MDQLQLYIRLGYKFIYKFVTYNIDYDIVFFIIVYYTLYFIIYMNVNYIVTMGLVPEIKYLVSCILYNKISSLFGCHM